MAMCAYLVAEYIRPQLYVGALANFPLGQLTLGTAAAAYALSGARGFGTKGIGTWLLLTFTAVIFASAVGAYNPAVSFAAINVWISWVVIYFLIISVVNTEQRFAFFIAVWLLCHFYMAQGGTRQFAMRGFRFATWGIIGAPGWFENSGEFGIAMAMLVAVSWHYYVAAKDHLTKWRKVMVLSLPVMGLLCVIGSSSRGAVVALVAIAFCALLRTKINFKTVAWVATAAAVVWMLVPAEQKARFSSAGTDNTSMMRKVYWLNGLEMAKSHPVLGVGYENWLTYYAATYRYSRISDEYNVHTVQLPHNIFIQCMAELGYVGLAVFVLLIMGTAWINFQTRQLVRRGPGPPSRFIIEIAYGLDEAMLCYIIAGFFVTVLYYPFFWINLALCVALNAIARANNRAATVRQKRPVMMRGAPVRPHGLVVPR